MFSWNFLLHQLYRPQAHSVTTIATAARYPEGATLLNSRCTVCHTLDRLSGLKGTPSEWKRIIGRMADKGAPIMDEEADRLAAYLATHPLAANPTVIPARASSASTVTSASAAASQPSVPSAQTLQGGADLLQSKCTVCHDLQRVSSQRKSLARWDETVSRMIFKGAALNPTEKTAVVSYLASTHGPGGTQSPATASANPPSKPVGAVATNVVTKKTSGAGSPQGRALFEQRCSACHSTNLPASQQRTASQWNTTVGRMISKGCALTPAEKDLIVFYLAAAYGPIAPSPARVTGGTTARPAVARSVAGTSPAGPSARPVVSPGGAEGRVLFQQRCSACHSTDIPAAQKRTAAQWSATVDRMISKGCPVTPAEKTQIVSYLAATYGPAASSPPSPTTGTATGPTGGGVATSPAGGATSPAASAQGQALFQQRCSACHSTSIPAAQRRTATQWNATVDRMILKGCPVTANEKTLIVSYLAATFGPVTAAPVSPTPATEASPGSTTPVTAPPTTGGGEAVQPAPSTGGALPPIPPADLAQGQSLFNQRCSACHSLDIPAAQRRTFDEWSATVDRMILKGCPVTASEKSLIVTYLSATYGSQPPPTPQPAPTPTEPIILPPPPSEPLSARALYEIKCSTCHGLDVVARKNEDLRHWLRLIDDMIENGLRLLDSERQAIGEYLATAYPKD